MSSKRKRDAAFNTVKASQVFKVSSQMPSDDFIKEYSMKLAGKRDEGKTL